MTTAHQQERRQNHHGFLQEEQRYQELRARFADTFARISVGVNDRETQHQLPFDLVKELQDAGFGALRVPVEYGGDGISANHLFRLLIDLAAIDSNIAHLWRGHFAFLEDLFARRSEDERVWWAERVVVDHHLIGNAQSEVGNENYQDISTVLRREDDGRLILDGEKYYSTGSIFADWTNVTARFGDSIASFPVWTGDPGVTVIDDWDGFGQQLTGTGTTRFSAVEVDPRWVTEISQRDKAPEYGELPSYIRGFYQVFLLSVLVGNAEAAVREITEHVHASTRRYPDAGPDEFVRDDALVQAVIGRNASGADSAHATVLRAADALQLAWEAARSVVAGSDDINEQDAAQYAREADNQAYTAQVAVIPQVLEVISRIFDAAGASSSARRKNLDRFWRNARTIASHNPLARRERLVGQWTLFGEVPEPQPQTTEEKE